MNRKTNMATIILAAGQSKRLGRPKQLIEFRGKKLLQQVIDLVDEIEIGPCFVVLGAFTHEIEKEIDFKKSKIILNDQWEEGMASSIRCGLEAIQNSAVENVLVLLTDQPLINHEILQQLVTSHEVGPGITACSYANQVGVPAIFSEHFFKELMQLKGDRGAKNILTKYSESVQTIPFPWGEMDVDSEEDLRMLE